MFAVETYNWYNEYPVCALVSERDVRRSEPSDYSNLRRTVHVGRQGVLNSLLFDFCVVFWLKLIVYHFLEGL